VRRIELQLGVAPSHYERGDASPAVRASAPDAPGGQPHPAAGAPDGDGSTQTPAREEALRL
jgi:hypothetical protein